MSARTRPILELTVFLIGASAPIVALAFYAAQLGGLAKAAWITPLGMLAPMLSAMLVQKLIARQPIKALGFAWGRLRWWIAGPLLFALFIVAALAVSVALTPALLASPDEIFRNLAKSSLLPHHLSLSQQLAVAIAITLLAGPVINLPIFLGEEVGWRGFMNPRLQTLFGKPGLIVGGAIWAVWHLPLILIGHNYPHHPWLGMALWIPICICLNILLAGLKQKSGSIFPCALAHGIINQLTMLGLGMMMVEAQYNELLHGPAGALGLALLIVPTWLVYRRVQ